MTFECQKFKREKSSIIPIEEIYTDLDINVNDPYVPNVGYRFDSPRRWCNDGSKNKSIGIRDLHLTPSSGDIRCRFLSYAHATITGNQYDWDGNDNEYKEVVDGNNQNQPVVQVDDVINYQCVSDAYNVQITPQNCFEEVITNILEFVNGASWKETRAVSNNYKTYSPKYHTIGRNHLCVKASDDSTFEYITNQQYLKMPITFMYHYDSNISKFECKNTDVLRWIFMTNTSKSYSDIVENDPVFDEININNRHYVNEDDFLETTHIAKGDDDSLDELDYYDTVFSTNGKPVLKSSELLLIIKRDDEKSIQAVYDLFNQRMPKIETLPVISVEGDYYVVPFIEPGFVSHFKIGIVDSSNNLTNVQQAQTPNGTTTNLKLDNVWDRLHLIYHASFAETRHRIIGRNGDHWDTPNKQFIVPSGDQDQFYIRFTTDGTHNILPIGCHFNVDLTFMLNPTNNLSTRVKGNHDTFKD